MRAATPLTSLAFRSPRLHSSATGGSWLGLSIPILKIKLTPSDVSFIMVELRRFELLIS